MILSKLGSAGVWASAFSTSNRLSRRADFGPAALQAHRHRQSQEIIRCTRRRLMLNLQINRPGEQLDQAASRERDVDAIGSDFHAAKQFHKYRFDFVWREATEFLRDLTATFDQLAPPWATVRFIVDGMGGRSGGGE